MTPKTTATIRKRPYAVPSISKVALLAEVAAGNKFSTPR